MTNIGRTVHVIKPTLENPRNTEGAFTLLNDGTIMYAYSRFVGGANDFSSADLYAIYSHDEGETWGEERVIYRKNPDDINIMSISFLRMNDGALGMFFLRKYQGEKGANCIVNLIRSYDEGITWSEPKRCIDADGYYCLVNDRVTRLKSGRVMFAVSTHPIDDTRNTVHIYISDDDCETFREAKERVRLPFSHKVAGMQEPGIMELDDGRLWLWARTGHGYQFETYSEDGGDTWGDVNPNEFFTSPNSPMNVKRIQDGRMLAIFNPVPVYNTRFLVETDDDLKKNPRHNLYFEESVYIGRTPLICAVSRGTPKEFDMKVKFLEDNPDIGFCYPAILARNDYVLIAYNTLDYNYGYETDIKMKGIIIKKVMLSEF